MGVCYQVGCRDCKVYRDLDKFYTMCGHEVKDRAAALEYRKEIERDSFRAGLLVSFMWDHKGHNCFVESEHDFYTSDYQDYTADVEYWSLAPPPGQEQTPLLE